jgi:hypothetical protein
MEELNARLAAVTKKLDDTAKHSQELQQKAVALEARVVALEGSNSFRDLMDEISGVAYLTPGGEGYSIVKVDVGYLTVSLENVQPYANGTRVTLQFGNPTAAMLTGAKATFEWGKANPKGLPDNDAAKSREVTFNESIAAGSWTKVNVVLDGVPASELGFVRVKAVTHSGMSLHKTF